MKVLWINDFSLAHNRGGAQRSNQLIIDEGLSLGHEIKMFNYDTDRAILNSPYDVVVSSNLHLFSQQPNAKELFQYIAQANYHVRLEHDANQYLSQEDRKTIFQSCKKTFFLTQFHYDQFLKMYGDIFTNVEIVPDPIDTSLFFDKKETRQNKTLYVGFMHYLKGTENFFNYVLDNPDSQFVMLAWGSDNYEQMSKSLPNVEYLSPIEYDEMPTTYNKYTDFYYHPVFFEPFCRSVAEALLCGMKVDWNEKIGSLHQFKEMGRNAFVTACNSAEKTFWSRITL